MAEFLNLLDGGLALASGASHGAWTPESMGAACALDLEPERVQYDVDGVTVIGWYDSSQYHRDLVIPGLDGLVPTTAAVIANGLKGVVFDGSHDSNVTPFTSDLLPNPSLHTFTILKQTGDGDATDPVTGGTTGCNYWWNGNPDAPLGIFQQTMGGVDTAWFAATAAALPFQVGAVRPRVPLCVEAWITSPDNVLHLRVGGMDAGTTALDGPVDVTSVGFQIGFGVACLLGSLILFDRSLTAGEQASARAFIGAKWGVAT